METKRRSRGEDAGAGAGASGTSGYGVPLAQKKTFSSGDVAKLLSIHTRTAAKMMVDEDRIGPEGPQGKIPCFRLPTGPRAPGAVRRVTRANLVTFLKRTSQLEALREIGEGELGTPITLKPS